MRTRYLVACLLLIAAACAAIVYCWPVLPERVPLHWNSVGEVDRHGPRAALWLLGPGMMALFAALGLALPKLTPRRLDVSQFESTYYYVCGVVVCLAGYVFALVLIACVTHAVNMQRALPAGMFVLLVLIGNPMGKVRPNAFIGIRTPWTLGSARVWYATHRLAARLMVASGLLGLCLLWLGAPHGLLLFVLLAWAPLAVGYSLLLYKRLPQ